MRSGGRQSHEPKRSGITKEISEERSVSNATRQRRHKNEWVESKCDGHLEIRKRLVGERWSKNSLHIVSFICKGSFAEGSLRFFVMTSRCIHVRALRVPSSGDTGLPALLASRWQEEGKKHKKVSPFDNDDIEETNTYGRGFSWMGRQHNKAIKLAVAWKMNTICSALPYASTAAFRSSGSNVGIIDVECRMASMICSVQQSQGREDRN